MYYYCFTKSDIKDLCVSTISLHQVIFKIMESLSIDREKDYIFLFTDVSQRQHFSQLSMEAIKHIHFYQHLWTCHQEIAQVL